MLVCKSVCGVWWDKYRRVSVYNSESERQA